MTYTKLIVGVLVVLAIAGGYFYPKALNTVVLGSPVGSTFNTAKIAAINFAPTTGSATSTSILNTDASDRYVIDGFAFCTGVGSSQVAYTGTGLNALTLKAATTTTNAPAGVSNTNNALALTIATSSNVTSNASTTVATNAFAGVWGSGTYMTFFTNATNTAACNIGVHYLAS